MTSSQGGAAVIISSVFHAALTKDGGLPDVQFVTVDSVHFYGHMHLIMQKSINDSERDGLIPLHEYQTVLPGHQLTVCVNDSAAVFNIVLHVIYEWPYSSFTPAFNDIVAAVTALKGYHISLEACMAPGKPLRTLLLALAPIHSMEIFAMSASNDLEELATIMSSYLLSHPLTNVADDIAVEMGARYLHRLASLDKTRMQRLTRLVLTPPAGHATSQHCTLMQQKTLTSAWALESTRLAWNAHPDLSASAIRRCMSSIEKQLTCAKCKESLKERIKQVVHEWNLVERTI